MTSLTDDPKESILRKRFDKPVTLVSRGFSDFSVDPDVVKEKSEKREDSGHYQLLPNVAKDLEKHYK